MKPAMHRPLYALPVFAMIGGCHLFAFPVIDKTCEDLAACPDGDPHTGETHESGDPGLGLSMGVVVGSVQDGALVLYVFDDMGDLLHQVNGALGADGVPGPVAYDTRNRVTYVGERTEGALVVFHEDGASQTVTLGAEPTDIYVQDGLAFVATRTALFRYDPGDGSLDGSVLGSTPFGHLDAVFPAYADNLYLLDLGGEDGRPDLYRGALTDGTVTLVYQAYDDGQSRSQDGFLGPEQMPFICSAAAGFYAVATLDSGVSKDNIAFPDTNSIEGITGLSVLSDVVDCDWDPEARVLLFVSRAHGVFTLEPGTESSPGKDVTQRWSPPEGSTYFRGAFFSYP